ncbi:hypothetical protein SAMN02745857_02664 [Andreprevotia lacus DSM 23236]|jgi:hypothetical protein|uniref:Uncharacterized protein n=1 Tax=Andreprevotia lacus DSM 23236 TaxID=1121001 RepID=A0A1W1XTU1_9NEIS|nr:hypothetical protein [Andreprevotia lacus]SMC26951.1 hypothetical protein SAMN02745857_02664 [Andreprevotia lacus DSM 23236]
MDGVIYHKTEKGQRELTERTLALSPRLRQLLILIDGKRNLGDLQQMSAGADLTEPLNRLLDAHLIEVLSGNPLLKPKAEPMTSQQGGLTPERVAAVLRAVHACSHQYLGQQWADKLESAIRAARTPQQLQTVIDDCLTALRRSGHRGAADTCQREVASALTA